MARKKKMTESTLPLDAGTLNASINSGGDLFHKSSRDDTAAYNLTKTTVQSKIEADADWRDGMNAFRACVKDDFNKLLDKVLKLEKQIKVISNE